MTARTPVHGLQVATDLHRFIEDEVLPGTGVDSAAFWKGFDAIVHDLAPKNIALLAERDRLQTETGPLAQGPPRPDRATWRPTAASWKRSATWCRRRPACKATTANVDAELALQAGPQLVVPILNARYALNAANARWGSLYDALYGTDVIAETDGAAKGQGLQPGARRQGDRVRARVARPVGAARQRLAQGCDRLQGRGRQTRRAA